MFFCSSWQVIAQDQQGVVPIEIRDYDTDKIQKLKDSGDFDYVETPTETPSLVSRIWEFILDIIRSIFNAASDTPVGRIITYIVGFVLLLTAIIKLLGMNVRGVFYSTSDKGKVDFEFLEENIHSLDFEKLLKAALSKDDFRLAIRLTYLKTLKHLSDELIVEWEAGKTNYDYIYEIKDDELESLFRDLSYYFDYAWYGDFEVDKPIYLKAEGCSVAILSSINLPVSEAV